MKILHRLLFVSALLGIIIGPVSTGAADSAMASSGPAGLEAMTGMNTSDAMPCCPEGKPIKLDCGKACPLALTCTTAIFSQPAFDHGWPVNLAWVSQGFHIAPYSELASALADPPERPPRI
jgi:hypothetical protein